MGAYLKGQLMCERAVGRPPQCQLSGPRVRAVLCAYWALIRGVFKAASYVKHSTQVRLGLQWDQATITRHCWEDSGNLTAPNSPGT